MNSAHILYIGGDGQRVRRITTRLREADACFRVRTETDFTAALARVQHEVVDCLVLDTEVAGREHIRDILQSEYPDIPVLLPEQTAHRPTALDGSAGHTDQVPPLSDISALASSIRAASADRVSNRALEREVTRNRALAELGRAALAGTNLDEVFARAVDIVTTGLDTEYAKVLERVSDEALLLRAGVGWHDGYVGSATVGTDADSQAGYTLSAAEPVVVEELATDRRFTGPDLLRSHDVVSGISVVIGTAGEPWGVLGTHSTDRRRFAEADITFVRNVANVLAVTIDREQTDEALRASRHRFREIATLNPDPIVRVAPDGAFQYVSPAGVELLGYPTDRLHGMSFDAVVSDASNQTAVDGFGRVLDGETVRDLAVTLVAADGAAIPVEISASPVYDGSEVTLVQCVVRDVTDRLLSQQRLEVLNRLLRHNLRNALTVILGRVDTIESAIEDPQVRESLSAIRETAGKLDREAEKGRSVERHLRAEDTVWVGLDTQLERVRNRTAAQFGTLDVTVAVDTPPVAVPDIVEPVLSELVENAAIHGGEGVAVTITGERTDGGLLRLRVADTGPGLPPLEQGVIEHGRESSLAHSRGIGLWSCNWLVQQAGGSLALDSTAEGTQISIEVPVET